MCELLKKHNDVTQANWAKVWKTKTTYQYIAWDTQIPNGNTNSNSIKTVNMQDCKYLMQKSESEEWPYVLTNH